MPFETAEHIRRIKDVEVEHTVARLALDRLMATSTADPSSIPTGLKITDVRLTSDYLAGTYLVRLFAEFETALRLFWPTSRATPPPSRTRDLLDGIAANRRIWPDQHANAHAVREYRNSLVHRRESGFPAIPMAEARGHLCKFLSFLPPDW